MSENCRLHGFVSVCRTSCCFLFVLCCDCPRGGTFQLACFVFSDVVFFSFFSAQPHRYFPHPDPTSTAKSGGVPRRFSRTPIMDWQIFLLICHFFSNARPLNLSLMGCPISPHRLDRDGSIKAQGGYSPACLKKTEGNAISSRTQEV